MHVSRGMVRAWVVAASLVAVVPSVWLVGSACGRSESPPAAPAADAAAGEARRDGGATVASGLQVSDGQRVRPADEPTAARVAARLRELHVYAGPAHGRDHVSLIQALKEFQAARGLPPTGVLDPATADALGVRVPPPGPPGT